ncbi:unnamed protein product [Amoebophrya sp. A25]|nr:unnamed protein product [Amoebophrya sp. A25]|eukprot:GSA25T00010393001.1
MDKLRKKSISMKETESTDPDRCFDMGYVAGQLGHVFAPTPRSTLSSSPANSKQENKSSQGGGRDETRQVEAEDGSDGSSRDPVDGYGTFPWTLASERKALGREAETRTEIYEDLLGGFDTTSWLFQNEAAGLWAHYVVRVDSVNDVDSDNAMSTGVQWQIRYYDAESFGGMHATDPYALHRALESDEKIPLPSGNSLGGKALFSCRATMLFGSDSEYSPLLYLIARSSPDGDRR